MELNVKQLCIYRADKQANNQVFKDISFNVKTGEILTLFGPSGIGKSSLLQAIAGFLKPTSGTIMNSFKLAYMFQDTALFPWMNVINNLLLSIKLNSPKLLSEYEKKALKLLALMNIKEKSKSYPFELSGGEKQKVALAQALLLERNLILMDEPFAALDSYTRIKLNEMIVSLVKKSNLSIIMVTHNKEEAIDISDKIILLRGAPATVYKTLQMNKKRNLKNNVVIMEKYIDEMSNG